MKLACPSCDSADVRRFSIVFGSGTSDVALQSATLGIGVVGGDIGMGAARTTTAGKQQSLLAQQLAPPAKRAGSGANLAFVVAIVLLFYACGEVGRTEPELPTILFAAVIGLLVFVVGVQSSREVDRWNNEEWPKLHAAWERSFLCMRCGHRFEFHA